jgi:hypothetical protein
MIRDRAFHILEEMGPDARTAMPELIRLVKSLDTETRLQAIQILGFIGPPAESAVPALITLLRSRSVEEREAVARSLGAIGSSAAKAIPDLLSAMETKRIPVGTAVPATGSNTPFSCRIASPVSTEPSKKRNTASHSFGSRTGLRRLRGFVPNPIFRRLERVIGVAMERFCKIVPGNVPVDEENRRNELLRIEL